MLISSFFVGFGDDRRGRQWTGRMRANLWVDRLISMLGLRVML